MLRQLRIRSLVSGIVQHTNDHIVKYNTMKTAGRNQILDFIRPYNQRHEFNIDKWGLGGFLSFECYVFFRSFYNPDLRNFLSVNLH